jgi:endonuclease/exonuclease/phosphatase (EEP) superfamily protein YafD
MDQPRPAGAGEPTPPARRGRRLRGFLAVCCWLYLAVVVGLWLLLREADLWWPATLLQFGPRWVAALPLALLLPAALLLRRRSLVPLLVGGLVVAWPLMNFRIPWGRLCDGTPQGMSVRVLTCNMHYHTTDSTPLDDLVADTHPEIVVLQEWSDGNASALLKAPDWHVHRERGQFIASRFPIRGTTRLGKNSDGPKGSVARHELETPAGVVTLFSVHLASPRHELYKVIHDRGRGVAAVQASSDRRWEQSEFLAHAAAEVRGPKLLAGDFNTPPESAIYRGLWEQYTDAFTAAGWGWGYTFYGGRTMVRIDHVFAGRGWACTRCWVGPDVGSLHRPVLADLVWTGEDSPPDSPAVAGE